MSSPTESVSAVSKEAAADLPNGIKIRIYRNDPFRAMGEIVKWLNGLKIGELYTCNMTLDANGWLNFMVAFREPKMELVPEDKKVDPVVVLYDTVGLLADTVEEISKLGGVVKEMQQKAFGHLLTEGQVSGTK